MKKDKTQALPDFAEMVKRSWPYAKMTEAEQRRALDVLRFAEDQRLLSGTYKQRWRQLLAVNNAFLDGLGYDGPAWRDETAPTF